MILEEEPITMAEVSELVGDSEKAQEVKEFIGKFTKMKAEDAKKMKEELKSLNLLKLKNTHIVKIVDLLPKDSTDLNKIMDDVSLDQEEVTKILDVVKKY